MLGCRREARKPVAALDIVATPSESPSDKVESWLEDQSQLSRKSKPRQPSTAGISWHCQACLRQPCNDPVATSCGHVFCQR